MGPGSPAFADRFTVELSSNVTSATASHKSVMGDGCQSGSFAFVLGVRACAPLPQTDLALRRINTQNPHFELLILLDRCAGRQLGAVQEALQPQFQLDEHAEVGDLRHLALDGVAGMI